MAANLGALALYFILSSVTAAYCLLGYWFAFGKLPWLWRAAVTCLALALLAPIRAYEPLVFFGTTALIFAGIAWCQSLWLIWRESRHRKEVDEKLAGQKSSNVSRQFQIRDLLGLTAIMGMAAWITRTILLEQVWLSWVAMAFIATVCVAMTLMLARIVHGQKRLLSLGALVVFTVIAAYTSRLFLTPGPLFPRSVLLDFLSGYVPQAPRIGNLLFLFSCFVVLGLWAEYGLKGKDTRSLLAKVSLCLSAVIVLAWGSAFVWLYLQMLPTSQQPTLRQTAENSYPTIVSRAQGFGNLTPQPAEAKSREVADLLKQECFVVVPWNATFTERKNYGTMLNFELEDLRYLGRQFDGQAVALEPKNPDLAADRVIDILRLGAVLGHDGLLGHSLIGMNVEGTAHWRIVPFRRKLSPQKARELLSELQRIEQERESPKVALGRQDAWTRLNDRWEYRLYKICVAPPEDFSIRQDPGTMIYRRTRERACCCSRLLITDLAIQIYRAEQGKLPEKLGDLTPTYLKEVPSDFFTDQLPIYRPSGDTYLLYSVGSHGLDNGGRFDGVRKFPSIEYDWNLDSLTRP